MSLRLIDTLDNWDSSHVQLDEPIMRKPRDYDAELKALDDKAKELKDRKLRQLGELVIATGADALPVEELAGALLSAAGNDDLVTKEEWCKRGAGFFQSAARRPSAGSRRRASGDDAGSGSTTPAAGETSPQ